MHTYISPADIHPARDHDGYEDFLLAIKTAFQEKAQRLTDEREPLFTTDAANLFEVFLDRLPAEARQHYNCHACRRFVNQFGGLVTISEQGEQKPVMWPDTNDIPSFFEYAVDAVAMEVRKATVTGVFYTADAVLGTPETGTWRHMAVYVPERMRYKSYIRTCRQESLEKRHDHTLLGRALGEYTEETIKQAVNLLRSETLYRNEKVLGVAEWLLRVYTAYYGAHSRREKRNILWRECAKAPEGFCHISSSMIGTLLDDIEKGMSLDEVKRRFDEKMAPTKYQRPQVAPTAGNVARAEKIVEKLGIANSLKRRYARLDEIKTLWTPPAAPAPVRTGVFSSVATKDNEKEKSAMLDAPDVVITWDKFRRTVLPTAKAIAYYVPMSTKSYAAMLTAEDPSAPPIIQWDNEGGRNPVSWYTYAGGSEAEYWGLNPRKYVEVTAVALQPNLWQEGFAHIGKGVFFILKGCKDVRCNTVSAGLFPEILKSELREVRATIEAYSRQNHPSGSEDATACGILLQETNPLNANFRVTTDVGVTNYRLDRWD